MPRKRFGQHFLQDPEIIARIVAAIDPRPGEHLVEIGPGLGALTFPLLARTDRLEAIEIDRDAVQALRESAARRPAGPMDPPGGLERPDGLEPGELVLHQADVLEFDFAALRASPAYPSGPPLRVVGNLPYNISTPLLFRLLEVRAHILDMHFMLQKEVVERMAAQPGEAAYGRLGVMLAPWVVVEPLFDIGPMAFRPPPRVVSSYVRVTPRPAPAFPLADEAAYARIVAAAFGQRRKTLRNALRGLLDESAIAQAGVDPGLRAEVLAPWQFAALAAGLNVSDRPTAARPGV